MALHSGGTLPQVLAGELAGGGSCYQVEAILREHDIAFKPFHFYG